MQLYVFPPSPNSLRCQAVANQLGIELELVPLISPVARIKTPNLSR